MESKKRFIIITITEFITTALSLLPGNTKRPFSNVSIWPKLAAKHAAGDPCENLAHTPVSARKCCWLGCTTGIASDCYYYRRGTKYFYTEPGIATLVHLTGGQNHKPHTHTLVALAIKKEKMHHGNVSRVGFSWLMELAVRAKRTRRSTGNLPGKSFRTSL